MSSLWDDLESLSDCPSYAYSSSADHGNGGTVKAAAHFHPHEDAEALQAAMKGFGTKDKVLIDVLTRRSSDQRQLICDAYQEATGQSLKDDLEGETRGDFEDVIVALVTTPAAYDCHEVMRAMKGAGSKDDILIEIFASRTNQQIKALCDVYLNETENLLVKDLRKEVGGDFGKALLLLAKGERDECAGVDVDGAKEDAQALYEASEKKWGTDESTFVEILCQRSESQLRQIFAEYKSISGKTLQNSIESEMSGELEELLDAVVKCVKCRPTYFAERLHESMKGIGTDESTVCRVMVSRSEVDLMDVRREYKKLYQESLHSTLVDDLSGDHGDCMVAICGGDDE